MFAMNLFLGRGNLHISKGKVEISRMKTYLVMALLIDELFLNLLRPIGLSFRPLFHMSAKSALNLPSNPQSP